MLKPFLIGPLPFALKGRHISPYTAQMPIACQE